MTTNIENKRSMIEGNAALIVIDIQQGSFLAGSSSGIPHMEDNVIRLKRAKTVIDAARESSIPIIFFQEIHRDNLVDFGRELDGTEGIHCLESNPNTEIAANEVGLRADDYVIQKRRYSCFFGTDLNILLNGLHIDTLILVGGLTDVCVHYTFVDAHQNDYFCRVVEDCVTGSSTEAHDAALSAIEYLQTGAVRSSDQIIGAISHQ
jgi:nicotinamidase-related amidase